MYIRIFMVEKYGGFRPPPIPKHWAIINTL